jgi:hypothetical protein
MLHSKNQRRDGKTMTAVRSKISMGLTAVCCSIKTGLSLVNQRGPNRCHKTSDTWSRTCCCPPRRPHCHIRAMRMCFLFASSIQWVPRVRSSLFTLTREHSSLLYLIMAPCLLYLFLSPVGGILTGV